MRVINENKCNPNKVDVALGQIDYEAIKQHLITKGYTSPTIVMLYRIHSFEENDNYFNKWNIFKGDIDANSTSLQYKLNEEIDSANISLIDSSNNSEVLNFKLPNRTKIVLIYDCIIINGELQHGTDEHFIVSGGQIVEKEIDFIKHYFHAYQLVNPIYLTKFIEVEANTFTNLPYIFVYDVEGNRTVEQQPETNSYSALERILQLIRYDINIDWSYRLNITPLREILENSGVGRNYSFNETNLYDVLFKICSYANVYPYFRFGSTNSEFELYGKNKEAFSINVAVTQVLSDCTSLSITDMSGKQANQVVTNIQNGITEKPQVFSMDNTYGGIMLQRQDDNLYMTGSDVHNLVLKVTHPIKNGQQITLFINGYSKTDKDVFVILICRLLEKSEWLVLESTSQNTTAYFEENDNKIYISHIMQKALFTDESVILDDFYKQDLIQAMYDQTGRITDELTLRAGLVAKSVWANVTYMPYFNGKVKFGDADGYQEVIVQEDSEVDTKLFANYLVDYANHNSGESILFSKVHSNHNEIYKVGDCFLYENKKMVITDVAVEVRNNRYEVNYVANITKPIRSELIGYDSIGDKNFIDPAKVQKRYSNLSTTMYVQMYSNLADRIESQWGINPIVSNQSYYNWLRYLLGYTVPIPNFAMLKLDNKYIRLPITVMSVARSVVYNINFPTNRYLMSGGLGGYNKRGLFQIKRFLSDENHGTAKLTNYTNSFGKFDNLSFIFVKVPLSYNFTYQNYDKFNGAYQPTFEITEDVYNNFLYSDNIYDKYMSGFLGGDSVKINKDTNELLNLTIQQSYEGSKNTFVFNNLVSIPVDREFITFNEVYITNGYYNTNDAKINQNGAFDRCKIEYDEETGLYQIFKYTVSERVLNGVTLCVKMDDVYIPLISANINASISSSKCIYLSLHY